MLRNAMVTGKRATVTLNRNAHARKAERECPLLRVSPSYQFEIISAEQLIQKAICNAVWSL